MLVCFLVSYSLSIEKGSGHSTWFSIKKVSCYMIPLSKWLVKIEFTEDLLGSVPYNKEVYSSFIASKLAEMSPDALSEELASVDNREEKGWTGFHRDDKTKRPFLYDYVVKGFLKEAARCMNRMSGSETKNMKAFIKVIDGNIFVFPRKIMLQPPEGTDLIDLDVLERPLRCQTAQGERVTVTRSDLCPAGTTAEFTLEILDAHVNEDLLREWFDYGRYRAFGQWRNGSYGRIVYSLTKVD